MYSKSTSPNMKWPGSPVLGQQSPRFGFMTIKHHNTPPTTLYSMPNVSITPRISVEEQDERLASVEEPTQTQTQTSVCYTDTFNTESDEHDTGSRYSDSVSASTMGVSHPSSISNKYSDSKDTSHLNKKSSKYSYSETFESVTGKGYTDDFESDDETESYSGEDFSSNRYRDSRSIYSSEDEDRSSRTYVTLSRSHTSDYRSPHVQSHRKREDTLASEDYDYSLTFEDVGSITETENTEKIQREAEMMRQYKIAEEEYSSALLSRLRQKRIDETDLTGLMEVATEPDVKQEDYHVHRFVKKKLKLLKQKQRGEKPSKRELAKPEPRPVTDYGISPSSVEALRLSNVMNRMKKIAKEDIHDPKKCKECRKLNRKLDEAAAERNFIYEKTRNIRQKMIDDRIQKHLIHMSSVSLIGNLASSLPLATTDPEVIMEQLNKGLSCTHWKTMPD